MGLVTFSQEFVVAASIDPAGYRMSNGSSSEQNSQELASFATAQGGLSRLVIARLKTAGVPIAPLLRRAGGLPPELIADPEAKLSVRAAKSRFWKRRRLL